MFELRWLLALLLVLCDARLKDVDSGLNISKDLKLSYFINLDRMPSRRHHMELQLNKVGLHAKRWRAVDWRRVALGEFDEEFVHIQGLAKDLLVKPGKEGNGTIGCYLSHLQALIDAGRTLHKKNELVLLMEDDVAIPEGWQAKMQKAVDQAPPDWELLKLSGWGSARVTDLVNRSDSKTKMRAKTTTPKPMLRKESMWSKFLGALRGMFSQEEDDLTFFMMREPFTEPAGWNWGTMGWGSQNFFYAGSGAYLVRGSSIKNIIRHLRSQTIRDYDAMLLSNGSMHFYEGWPHIFDLAHDAFSGPGLHGHKAMDEFDRTWSKSDTGNITDSTTLGEPSSDELTSQVGDTLQPWQPSNPANVSELKVADTEGLTHSVRLNVLNGGASVRDQSNHTSDDSIWNSWPLQSASMGEADKSIIRSASIKRHTPKQESTIESTMHKSLGPPGQVADLHATAPVPTASYGHPEWLKTCSAIYLDVGSGSGGQVKQLFEPEKYFGYPMVQTFEENVGAAEDRKLPSASTGLCALGLEPDPARGARLKALEDQYTARGWRVHFYPFAAWREEGRLPLNEAVNSSNEGESKAISAAQPVWVRTVNLADFISSLPPHTVKLMKVDIEGAEYETIWRLLQKKVLCSGTVDVAYVEAHKWGDTTNWKDERSPAALQKRIEQADCKEQGAPSKALLTDFDAMLREEEAAKEHVKRNMYAFALAVFAMAAFIGYQKFRGETILEKIDKLGVGLHEGHCVRKA